MSRDTLTKDLQDSDAPLAREDWSTLPESWQASGHSHTPLKMMQQADWFPELAYQEVESRYDCTNVSRAATHWIHADILN